MKPLRSTRARSVARVDRPLAARRWNTRDTLSIASCAAVVVTIAALQMQQRPRKQLRLAP
jgi:hypothetical protein